MYCSFSSQFRVEERSPSASASAALAASWNLNRATRKCFRASMDSTRAPSAMWRLRLLQILLDQRRLFAQEAHVLMRGLQEIRQHLHRLLERLRKLPLLLVSPRCFQVPHPGIKTRHKPLQIVVESGKILGEATYLGGVYVGFGHS